MRMTQRILPAMALTVLATACATATRMPVTDVPSGNYVLVEPTGGEYTAIALNERAHTLRVGTSVMTGQHWVDADGQLHVVPDEGPCAGLESVWTYSYSGNRLTMDVVSDACTAEDGPPDHMVWERS